MLIERNEVILTESQSKLIKSGWGNESVENTLTEKITYLSDGLKIQGFFSHPKSPGKYSSIIWCRGGYGKKGALDDFTASGILGQFASWGYAVFASEYRGGSGGEGKDEFGGSDLNDILNILRLAEEFPEADTNNWGIEGWSRGGMMTYLALTRTDIFKAASVIGGIANLKCNSDESPFMKQIYSEIMAENDYWDDFCKSRSIVSFPHKLNPDTPILIIHGNKDTRVLPHDSLDLSNKLLQLKHPHRLILFENGDHFLRSHKSEVDEMRRKWFEKYLKQSGDENA